MKKWLSLLLLFSTVAWGQELPDFLQMNLNRSEGIFESYNNKTPEQIDDGIFDDEEILLFAQLEQVECLDLSFTKEDLKTFKVELIKLISDKFSTDQLLALSRIARSKELNKKSLAKYFELALNYKLGDVDDRHLKKSRI